MATMAIEVTERPILFSGEMVRALPRKTQTRRVMRPQPTQTGACWNWKAFAWVDGIPIGNLESPLVWCPYGKPGDRLWVRETWATDKECSAIAYRADLPPDAEADEGWLKRNAPKLRKEYAEWRWKPSIHMPRWASRFTLEVVAVKVERVQDISEMDAMADGCQIGDTLQRCPDGSPAIKAGTRRISFMHLWDSIYLKRGSGWEKNPWIWAITFKPAGASQ